MSAKGSNFKEDGSALLQYKQEAFKTVDGIAQFFSPWSNHVGITKKGKSEEVPFF